MALDIKSTTPGGGTPEMTAQTPSTQGQAQASTGLFAMFLGELTGEPASTNSAISGAGTSDGDSGTDSQTRPHSGEASVDGDTTAASALSILATQQASPYQIQQNTETNSGPRSQANDAWTALTRVVMDTGRDAETASTAGGLLPSNKNNFIGSDTAPSSTLVQAGGGRASESRDMEASPTPNGSTKRTASSTSPQGASARPASTPTPGLLIVPAAVQMPLSVSTTATVQPAASTPTAPTAQGSSTAAPADIQTPAAQTAPSGSPALSTGTETLAGLASQYGIDPASLSLSRGGAASTSAADVRPVWIRSGYSPDFGTSPASTHAVTSEASLPSGSSSEIALKPGSTSANNADNGEPPKITGASPSESNSASTAPASTASANRGQGTSTQADAAQTDAQVATVAATGKKAASATDKSTAGAEAPNGSTAEQPAIAPGTALGTAQPAISSTASTATSTPAGPALSTADRVALVNQVASQVSASPLAPGNNQVNVQLHPNDWGSVNVQVSITPSTQAGGNPLVTAHLVAESPSVKDALDSQMGELRKALEASGLHLQDAVVSVQAASAGTSSGATGSGADPGTRQHMGNWDTGGSQTPSGGQQGQGGFASFAGGGHDGGRSASYYPAAVETTESPEPTGSTAMASGRLDTRA